MRTAQDAITDSELRENFEHSLKSVNKVVDRDHPKSLLPVLEVITRHDFDDKLEQVVIGLADLPDTSQKRQEVFEAIGAKILREAHKIGAPVAVLFTCEGWTRKEMPPKGKKVADMADKKEIVFTAGRTVDGRRVFAIHDIVRGKKKEIAKLNLKLFAPKTGLTTQVESSLLDAFYRGAAKEAKKGQN